MPSLATCAFGALLLAACTGVEFGAHRPAPGAGPGGKPMRTATETSVGLPPIAHAPVYPLTARVHVTDNYFGTKVADPWRWLENLNSPAVRRWVARQNALSRPRLAALPARAWLEKRLTALWNYQRYEVPVKRGRHYFYLYNDGQQNQSALYVADDLSSPGRLLFDPNTVRADATLALSGFAPDVRGDLVAYATSDAGTDWQVWHFCRTRSGKDLPDTLRFTKFYGVSWARDDSGVYYSRYPALPEGRGDESGRPAVYFHRLGTAQDSDRLIYAVTDSPTHIPSARVTDDGHYLIVNLEQGYENNAVDLIDLTRPGSKPHHMFAAWDAFYAFIGSQGGELLFRTTLHAPLGRVIAVDAEDPARRRTVVPEDSAALASATYVGGRIFAQYILDAHAAVKVYELDGRPVGAVPLPGLGTVEGFRGESAQQETFFSYTDFVTPRQIWRVDVPANRTSLWRAAPAPPASARFVTGQVFYTSRDGTRVPMYITQARDTPRDGNQPFLLYGYGGFDISITPSYSPAVEAWLEMGGSYAVANLRGGGEYGEAWHEAGTLEEKQHVFDDFIAAAQYLIDRHYTRSARLGIHGRSNGGLLVGAVLVQRPDLFGVALPAVGVLDMLRYQTASANARQWSSDYGLSENRAQFAALYAYSPVQNVHPGVCYPPTLITTADHDDRVAPWHSYKFAAALQAAQFCANPILIRVETRAGHGAGKPVWMQIEDFTDQWAFLARWLGVAPPAG